MTIAQLRTGNLLAARKVAKSLGVTEHSIDSSILAQADLLSALVHSLRESGSALVVGHAAVKKAVAALDAMTAARDLLVDCHSDLADVRDHWRLRAEDVGCSPDKIAIGDGQARAA